jgi:hypothetical protein
MDKKEIEAYLNRRLGGFVVWGLNFFSNAPVCLVLGHPARSAREAYLRIECRWCLHERETEYSDWHDDTDLVAMLNALQCFARNALIKIILTDAWNMTFCLDSGNYLTLEATHGDFENWQITCSDHANDFTIVGLAEGEIAIFDSHFEDYSGCSATPSAAAQPPSLETCSVDRPVKWWQFWK